MAKMRSTVLTLVMLAVTPTKAQERSVDGKDLVASLGGGISSMKVTSDVLDPNSYRTAAGTLTFEFNYAVMRRFAIGAHYDRSSMFEPMDSVKLLRSRVILLDFHYRPWVGETGFVDVMIGTGFGEVGYKRTEDRIYDRATGGCIAFTLGYHQMLTEVIGLRSGVGWLGIANTTTEDHDGNSVLNTSGGVAELNASLFNGTLSVFLRL